MCKYSSQFLNFRRKETLCRIQVATLKNWATFQFSRKCQQYKLYPTKHPSIISLDISKIYIWCPKKNEKFNSGGAFSSLNVKWLLKNKKVESFKTYATLDIVQVSEKMSTIEYLPNEVLEHIFRHLPLASDQQNIRLVCKKWRDIIQQMRSIPSLNYTRLLKAEKVGYFWTLWNSAHYESNSIGISKAISVL